MTDNQDFTYADFLLNELKEMKDKFKDVPKSIIQRIVEKNLQEEKKAILQLYEDEVSSLPRGDPIKLEIINIMLWLGINPFDKMDINETLSIG